MDQFDKFVPRTVHQDKHQMHHSYNIEHVAENRHHRSLYMQTTVANWSTKGKLEYCMGLYPRSFLDSHPCPMYHQHIYEFWILLPSRMILYTFPKLANWPSNHKVGN